MESLRAVICQIVIGDAGLARTERRPRNAASFRMSGADRKTHLTGTFGSGPRGSYNLHEVAVGTCKRDAGRGELAALCSRLAHQLKQLGTRFRTNQRFIGCAERSK